MLLHGRRTCTLPHRYVDLEEVRDSDYNATGLQKRQTYLNHLFTQLWSRWPQKYLPALREAHKNQETGRGDSFNTIRVGDIVLVHEDNRKRVMWPLAVVTKLKMGCDGLCQICRDQDEGRHQQPSY